MPLGSTTYIEQQQQYYSYSANNHSNSAGAAATLSANGGARHEDSAISILQSVKEQEAQFERLTREIEAERQTVASQLEKIKIDSVSGSLNSLNSANSSIKWREQKSQQQEDTTLNYSNGSHHLVDSFVRELHDRGLMRSQSKDDNHDDAGTGASYYDRYSNRLTASPQSSVNSYQQQSVIPMNRGQNYSHAANYAHLSQLHSSEVPGYNGTASQNYTDHEVFDQQRFSGSDYVDSAAAAAYISGRVDSLDTRGGEANSYRQHADVSSQMAFGFQPNHVQAYEPLSHYDDNNADLPVDSNSGQNVPIDTASQHSFNRGSKGNLADGQLEVKNSSRNHQADNYPSSGRYDPYQNSRGFEADRHYLQENPSFREERYSQEPGTSVGFSYTPKEYDEDEQLANAAFEDEHPQYPFSTNGLHPSSNNEPSGFTDSRPVAEYSNPHLRSGPNFLFGSRSSLDPQGGNLQWRPPELREVIEYLSHPNDSIKANAAAYLQHLCYGNNSVKVKTRVMGGIPALIELLHSNIPEVHRHGCGALLNLSRGYENDENKRAIKNAGGIDAMARLLVKSTENDVRELITGILWNMSSMAELKKPIVDCALASLVKSAIIPNSGWSQYSVGDGREPSWSSEFKNATGVLRNISSDGYYARKSLRECDGLSESLMHVTRSAISTAAMENKSVENCVCVLRNMSYRLMEVDYPDYYDKKSQTPQSQLQKDDALLPTCFGKSTKPTKPTISYPCRTPLGRRRGEQLWQPDVADMYIKLLSECSNTDTLEAAVGAIQNITACEWQPAVEFREQVRKQKGLPIFVELLGLEGAHNELVCGVVIALRNLAIDKKNKTLIGIHALKKLTTKLPLSDERSYREQDFFPSEETVRAVIATLYEILKDKESSEHASKLVNDTDALSRLMSITKSSGKYFAKTLRGAHQLLAMLWRFADLHTVYRRHGYKETDFLSRSMRPRTGEGIGTLSSMNTLTRPRSEAGSRENTLARSNPGFKDDASDERPVDVSESYLARHPSQATLPIQRPIFQPNEESYAPQLMAPYDLDYNPSDNQHSYPNLTTRHSYNVGSSHTLEVQPNGSYRHGETYHISRPGQTPAEPLYARVDKRKTLPPTHTASNLGFATSMTSLNDRGDYSYQSPLQANSSAGVDSWV